MKDHITNIFISSDQTELAAEREILWETFNEMNVNPVLFELFPAVNDSPNIAALREVEACDIFVIVLWRTLSQAVQEEYYEAVELGKPILLFLKSLHDDEQRDDNLAELIGNLRDSIQTGLHRRTVYKPFRKLLELRSYAKEAVINEIAKYFQKPKHTISREEMYDSGNRVMKQTQKRLYVYQNTPSLFLGARPYLADNNNKIYYEKRFLDNLVTWIERSHESSNTEMLYMFSLHATVDEIWDKKLMEISEYMSRFKELLKEYQQIETKTGLRYRFAMVDFPICGPLIVGDNMYGIWLLGEQDAVSFSQENKNLCDFLARMLKAHCQKTHPFEEIFRLLEKRSKSNQH